jgi:hypothetical protein
MFRPYHRCTGPGGHLIIRDGEQIMYNHERPPPPEGQEPDVAAYMQGTSIVANVNRIFAGGALRRGFLVRCALLPLGHAKATHQVTGCCLNPSSKCLKLLLYALFRLDASRSPLEITAISTPELTAPPSRNTRPSVSRTASGS